MEAIDKGEIIKEAKKQFEIQDGQVGSKTRLKAGEQKTPGKNHSRW